MNTKMSLPMRWHCLQHVPFEGPASLATWVQRRGDPLTVSALWKDASLPSVDEFDGLFILGGPMNVYEVDAHPWLTAEQDFITRAVDGRKPVLGVCLGAQLLAVVLGGKVTAMLDQEIGWYPVELTPVGRELPLFQYFPDEFPAFHWHGDSFSVPPGAVHIARSDACESQGFVYENHVVALQFHLESDRHSVAALLEHCCEDLGCGEFVQDPCTIEKGAAVLPKANRLLFNLLDKLILSSRPQENVASNVSSRELA